MNTRQTINKTNTKIKATTLTKINKPYLQTPKERQTQQSKEETRNTNGLNLRTKQLKNL